jgi:hypothetical protein
VSILIAVIALPPVPGTMGPGRLGSSALSQSHAPDLFRCAQHPGLAGHRVRGR